MPIAEDMMDYQSSAKLRDRAQRCRTIATTYADAATRDQMFGIAAEYDRMADRMARDESTKKTFERMAAILESVEKHRSRTLASSDAIRQTASVSREMIASSRELMARIDRLHFIAGGPPPARLPAFGPVSQFAELTIRAGDCLAWVSGEPPHNGPGHD